MIELIAGKDDVGRRLDRILRKALPDLSLSLIHRLLRQKKILIDNKPATLNYRIEQGMVIKINAPATDTNDKVNKSTVNQVFIKVNKKNLGLPKVLHSSPHCSLPPVPILWQNSDIIFFNKPQGLSTHGPNSLVSIVTAWLTKGGAGPLPRSLSFKPGPLHRLDKPTSGAIAFSLTLEGAKLFSALLREHKLEKTYIAIVEGHIEKKEGTGNGEQGTEYGEIIWRDTLVHDKNARKSFINPRLPTPHSPFPVPKKALTTIKPLASNGKYSLIEARITTGRHHQIRAQAASHGHPLAGDIKYGGHTLPDSNRKGSCFWLHAWEIRFNGCPDGFPQEITAPLPEAFRAKIKALFER